MTGPPPAMQTLWKAATGSLLGLSTVLLNLRRLATLPAVLPIPLDGLTPTLWLYRKLFMWAAPDQERFLGIKAPRAPDGSYVCCGERFEFKTFVEHRRASDEHGGFGQGSRRRS